MTLTHTAVPDDFAVPNADVEHAIFFGVSKQGKSMLGRLNDAERHVWSQWMDANPGVNGMAWPGWATVYERETKA